MDDTLIQQDPPSKKLYDGLVGEKLYTKSYDEFQKQFSTPEAIQKLHQGLVSEKLYSKGADEFTQQFFPIQKKSEPTPDFGLASPKDLALSNTPKADNTAFSNQTLTRNDNLLHRDEIKANREVKLQKAIDNTLLKKAPVSTLTQYKGERKKIEDMVASGDLVYGADKDGKPGLKRTVGFWEGLVKGWQGAVQSGKDADKFVNEMSDEEAVDFYHKQAENKHPEYIGEQDNLAGAGGRFLGEAGPFLGKAGAGLAIGAGAVAAAPESLGASLTGLPVALSFLFTAPDMANHGAMGEALRTFEILKREHPETDEVELMKEARKRQLAGGVGGIITNAILTGGGSKMIPANKSNVIANAIKSTVKAGLNMGSKTASVDLATQVEGNIEGVKSSPEEMLDHSLENFKQNATVGTILHTLTMAANGAVKLPKIVNSSFKNAIADVPASELKEILQANEASGTIPEGSTEKVMADINGFKEAKKKVIDGLDDDVEMSVTGLIQKKDNLLKEQENKDGNFAPVYEKKIEDIDKKIKKITETGDVYKVEKDDVTNEPLTNIKNEKEAEVLEPSQVITEKAEEPLLPKEQEDEVSDTTKTSKEPDAGQQKSTPAEPIEDKGVQDVAMSDNSYGGINKRIVDATSKEENALSAVEKFYKDKSVSQDAIDQLIVYGDKVKDFKDIMPEASKAYDEAAATLHEEAKVATENRIGHETSIKEKLLNDINDSFKESGFEDPALDSVKQYFDKLLTYGTFDELGKRLKYNKFKELKQDLVLDIFKKLHPDKFEGVDKYEDVPANLRDGIEKMVDNSLNTFKEKLSEKPQPILKDKGVAPPSVEKSEPSRQEKLNDLIDLTQQHNKAPKNSTSQKNLANKIKLQAGELGVKVQHIKTQGYIEIQSEAGKKIKKKNTETNSTLANDFKPENYSKETHDYVEEVKNETLPLEGLSIKGIDGRRLSLEQTNKALQDIKEGKVTNSVKAVYDTIEENHKSGHVELIDYDSRQVTPIPVEEYKKAFKFTEEDNKAAETINDVQGIIKSEGLTLENIGNNRHLFEGFPFTPEDLVNVKNFLNERRSIREPEKVERETTGAPEDKTTGVESKTPQAETAEGEGREGSGEVRPAQKAEGSADAEAQALLSEAVNKKEQEVVVQKAGSQVGDIIKKLLTSNRGLGDKWMELSDAAKGERMFASRDMRRQIFNLKEAAKKEKFTDTKQISNALADISGNDFATLPKSIQDVVRDMRATVDGYSESLVVNGLVSPAQAKVIEENLGEYLNRSYKLHTQKGYAPDPHVFNDAVNFIAQEQLQRLNADPKTASLPLQEKVDKAVAIAKQFATDIITVKKEAKGQRYTEQFSKDLSTLKERKDIPEPIRKLMGEYTDPVTQFAVTISKLATLNSQAKLLNSLKDTYKGTLFFEKGDVRPEGFNYEVASGGSQTWNPLSGMYTNKIVIDALQEVDAQHHWLALTYKKAFGVVKLAKTVYSLPTQAVNFFANPMISLANGHFKLSELGSSWKYYKDTMFGGEKSTDEFIETLVKKNVIGQSVSLRMITDMLRHDKADEFMLEQFTKKTPNKLNPVTWVKGLDKIARKQYAASDSFWKAYGFMNEATGFSKAMFNKEYKNLSTAEKEQVNNIAAERIKNTYPTYDRALQGLMWAGKNVPFIGNFMAFQAEVIRNIKNNITYAAKDLKDPNPAVKALGAKRMGGIISYIALKQGINYFAVAITGNAVSSLWASAFDNDEEKAKRKNLDKFAPPWLETHNIAVTKKGEGIYSAVDLDRLDPYNQMWQTLNSFAIGRGGGLNRAGEELIEPFIEPDMIATAAYDIIKNRSNAGYPIYNEADDEWSKTFDKLAYLYRIVEPTTLKYIQRVKDSDKPEQEATLSLLGGRSYDIDIAKVFARKLTDARTKLSANSGAFYFEKDKEGNEAKYDENLKVVMKELSDLYKSAVHLGVNPDALDDIIKGKLGRVKSAGKIRDMIKDGVTDELLEETY